MENTKAQRFFNIAGPMQIQRHYLIDPLSRIDWQALQILFEQQSYFALHAPRQTGKTSILLATMDKLNQSDQYVALYVNIEAAQAARHDVNEGMTSVCEAIAHRASNHLQVETLIDWLGQKGHLISPQQRLNQMLSYWSQTTDKPCVLLLDEVDALVGDTLISLLRQIRAGYDQRPQRFPQSVVLCGVRDVRDYRIHSDGEIIAGGSAFNIKSASLRLGNFSQADIQALYQQHTNDSGQQLSPAILNEIWLDTQGQPWLVNALGRELFFSDSSSRERKKLIELEDYKVARERLIYSRTTHLDQLSNKLKEPRVRRVIDPMLATDAAINAGQTSIDDLQYVEDLGLIQLEPSLRISNRIYQQLIYETSLSGAVDSLT